MLSAVLLMFWSSVKLEFFVCCLKISCKRVIDQDVFLNAVGGIKINETASDLAVLIAIVSSMTNQAVSSKTAIFGEVGLGGEIRPVSRGQERIKEASKLGFKRIIVPLKNKASDIPDVEIIGVDNLRDAVKVVFGSNRVKNDEQIYPDE
jgi:DNA repair protein RadA/Sms